jgi:hypothetical protein
MCKNVSITERPSLHSYNLEPTPQLNVLMCYRKNHLKTLQGQHGRSDTTTYVCRYTLSQVLFSQYLTFIAHVMLQGYNV